VGEPIWLITGLNMKSKFFLAAAVAAVSLAGAVQAASPILSYDQNAGSGGLGNPPFTLGWQFTTTKAMSVTGLGVFDDSLDGLSDSYSVGLWDSSGTLLTSGCGRNRGSADRQLSLCFGQQGHTGARDL
jgi:hypothetical protein